MSTLLTSSNKHILLAEGIRACESKRVSTHAKTSASLARAKDAR